MIGRVMMSTKIDNKSTFAVGIQPKGAAFGNMAVVQNGDPLTVSFDVNDIKKNFDGSSWILNPEVLKAPGDWNGPDGNGEEWGQNPFNGLFWDIWSYNDSTEAVEDWGGGPFHFAWVEKAG